MGKEEVDYAASGCCGLVTGLYQLFSLHLQPQPAKPPSANTTNAIKPRKLAPPMAIPTAAPVVIASELGEAPATVVLGC